LNADYFFGANKKAISEQIAAYFVDLAKYFEKKNKKEIDIFFDRNPSHKNKDTRNFRRTKQGFKHSGRVSFYGCVFAKIKFG
jgi:uncharacterized protein (DUF927 family)